MILLSLDDADADGSVIVVHAQAGSGGRYLLFEVVVEVEVLTKKVIPVAGLLNAHVVAELVPVEAGDMGGDESEEDDGNDEKDSAGADAASGHAVALGLLILDEFDDAPEDQKQRPVMGKQSSQMRPGQHVQIAQQEDDAEDDQDNRSGEGTAVMARWNRRWHRILNRDLG